MAASQQEGGGNSGLPLTYTLEVEINHMMVKELAERIGVVPETVINWEKRNPFLRLRLLSRVKTRVRFADAGEPSANPA